MRNRLLNWISDLLWPLACLGCRRGGVRLCQICADALPPPPPPTRLEATPLVMAGTMQEPILERAVWYLKYRNAEDLAEPLGNLLAGAIGRAGIRADCVVPIPLHPSRLRERGYNQSALLGGRLSAVTGLPLLSVLTRTRKTKSQVRMRSRQSRQANLEGAFHASSVRGRHIILIDDVATTGATLLAAVRALNDAGAAAVTAAVIARG